MAKKKLGRPSMFVPEVRQTLISIISSGGAVSYACASVGIEVGTLRQWLEIGRAIREGTAHARIPKEDTRKQEFVDFVDQIEKARITQKLSTVNSVLKAGRDRWTHRQTGAVRFSQPPPMTWVNDSTGELAYSPQGAGWTQQNSGEAWAFVEGTWQAAAWYLERSDPEQWGRKDKLVIEGGLTIAQVNEVAKVLQAAGLDPAKILEDLAIEVKAQMTVGDG